MHEPTFFETPADFRKWLAKHHRSAAELWVGFYKKGSGRPSITWPESVEEALCYGWIDGVRKRIDDEAYVIRFTPRKATSIWSAVNLAKMQELIAAKRVSPHGLAVFEARDQTKTNKYSFEQKATAALERAQEQEFRANEAAWKHFSAQPPGYRHQLTWWVISAKKAETRARRLAQLIEASARGERLDRFVSKK